MIRLLLLLVLLGGAGVAVLLATPGRTEKATVTAEHIMARIEPLAELATHRVEVHGIVTVSGRRRWLLLPGRGVVLIVRGAAILAVDLTKAEIDAGPDTVTVALPAPRVLDSWVDVEKSTVWDRRGWVLTGDDLDGRAWAEAAAMVRGAAGDRAHLAAAHDRAGRLVVEALRGACPGRRVIVTWLQ